MSIFLTIGAFLSALFYFSNTLAVTNGVPYGNTFEREGTIQFSPYDSSDSCRGVLFEDRFVITAAHCVYSTSIRYFHLPRTKESYWIYSGSIKVHPSFDIDSMQNDIAVLKLSEPVKEAKMFRPLRIATGNPVEGEKGILYTGKHENDTYFSTIQVQAILKISSVNPTLAPPNVFSVTSNNSKICRGDSGAPFIMSGELEDYLIGLTSNGPSLPVLRSFYKYCRPTFMDTFTSIGMYHDWIQETVFELKNAP